MNVYSAHHRGEKKLPIVSRVVSHGVLTDLDYQGESVSQIPFDPEKKATHDYIYWQCFPREALTITLQDLGNSAEELYWNDTYSLLTIEVYDGKRVRHEYIMRRAWPVETYLEKFKSWQTLMKHEKYVCIAGSAPYLKDEENEKSKQKVVLWYFEQFKTKKGCDSYFERACAQEKKLTTAHQAKN